MTQLRNIVLDLVEKRLWPVAVALVALLVAVPVLLGADPAPAPVVAVTDTGTPVAAQVAAAAPDQPGGRARLGALRDPFGRAQAPAPGGTTAVQGSGAQGLGPTAAADSAPTDPQSGGSGLPLLDDLLPLPSPSPPDLGLDGFGGGLGTGSGSGQVAEAAERVTVRVGRAGELELRRGVTTRTPLPSVADPFLVYLGNKPDGRSAQFLVSSDSTMTGDAACRPSDALCEEIVMRAGQTQFFDVVQPDGQVVQYQMDVVRVGR